MHLRFSKLCSAVIIIQQPTGALVEPSEVGVSADDLHIMTDDNPDGVYYADYKVLPLQSQDARSKSIYLECLEKEPKEQANGVVEMVDIKVHLRPSVAWVLQHFQRSSIMRIAQVLQTWPVDCTTNCSKQFLTTPQLRMSFLRSTTPRIWRNNDAQSGLRFELFK
jgi:hypothetical protein